MLGLYLDTLIIGHIFCSMISKLNELERYSMSPYQCQYPHIRIWIKMEQVGKRWGIPVVRIRICISASVNSVRIKWHGVLCSIFCFVVVVLLFVQNTLFITKLCKSFCIVNSFSILNILHIF